MSTLVVAVAKQHENTLRPSKAVPAAQCP